MHDSDEGEAEGEVEVDSGLKLFEGGFAGYVEISRGSQHVMLKDELPCF